VPHSVVDPDSLNPDLDTDPDPAFQMNLNPDKDQISDLVLNSDPGF
jgi:hypothetical protein